MRHEKISPRYVDDGEDNWPTIESLPDCNVSPMRLLQPEANWS